MLTKKVSTTTPSPPAHYYKIEIRKYPNIKEQWQYTTHFLSVKTTSKKYIRILDGFAEGSDSVCGNNDLVKKIEQAYTKKLGAPVQLCTLAPNIGTWFALMNANHINKNKPKNAPEL